MAPLFERAEYLQNHREKKGSRRQTPQPLREVCENEHVWLWPEPTSHDVRYLVTIEGKGDLPRTFRKDRI
jgi:hypothetical protein